MIRRLFLSDKVRFLFVGVFNTLLGFALLNGFVFILHMPALVGNALAVIIGISISYVLNHTFVFSSDDKMSFKSFFIFFIVTGFSTLVLQSLVLWGTESIIMAPLSESWPGFSFLRDQAVLRLNLEKVAAVGVGMVWNYLSYKHIIFKGSASDVEPTELEQQTEN